MNRLESWIAARYFFSKKKTGLISFTSYVSIIGIAIGTFALIVTLSILNGFEDEIYSRVIDIEAHITVTGKNINDEKINEIHKLLDENNIDRFGPYVEGKSVLTSFGTESVVLVKGIDLPEMEQKFAVENSVIRGRAHFFSPVSDLPGIMVGYRLADKLGLYIGDSLSVVNPLKIGGTLNIPIVGTFVLTGIFKLDLFDYDDKVAFIELTEGQQIFRKPNTYSGIHITLKNRKSVDETKAMLSEKLGDEFTVATWGELHKSLFGAMKLEKYGSFLALCFIIIVAIFNLTSSLVMLVIEKVREIGMLQALGVNQKQIRKIFLRLGMLTGCLGLAIGAALSVALCLIQQKFQIIPLPSVYFIPYIPVKVQLTDVLAVIFSGLLLIYIGAIYPSIRVGKFKVLDAIQYEK